MMQGLSLGGEYGSSATYLSEVAGRQRRGFFSSFQYVTLIAGQLVASVVLLVLQFSMSEARPGGLGLADPVRDRRRAGAGRLLHPPPAHRDRELRQRQGSGRAALERREPVPRSSEGGVAGDGAHRRRHLGLLRLHHLHAEIPGQHVGLRPRDGEPGDDRGPVRLHVPAAARRSAVRPGRAQAGDDRLRPARRDRHGAALHRAGERRRIPMPPSRW